MKKKNVWIDPKLHKILKICAADLSVHLGLMVSCTLANSVLETAKISKLSISKNDIKMLQKMVKDDKNLALWTAKPKKHGTK